MLDWILGFLKGDTGTRIVGVVATFIGGGGIRLWLKQRKEAKRVDAYETRLALLVDQINEAQDERIKVFTVALAEEQSARETDKVKFIAALNQTKYDTDAAMTILRTERDALRGQVQDLRRDYDAQQLVHAQEIQRLNVIVEEQGATIRSFMAKRDAIIERLKKSHAVEIAKLKHDYEAEIAQLQVQINDLNTRITAMPGGNETALSVDSPRTAATEPL